MSARFSAKLLAVRREGSAIMSFWDPNLGEDSEPSDAISPRIVERHEMWVLGVPQCFEIGMSEVGGFLEYRGQGNLKGGILCSQNVRARVPSPGLTSPR